MEKLSLYLGCITPNRYPGIEKATKLCLERMEIDYADLPGASCCPAPGVFRSFDKATWLALASRNIVLSEEMGRNMLTICNGCYGSLVDANNELKDDPALKKSTNAHLEKIGKTFKGTVDVRHIIELLYDEPGPEKMREMVTSPLDLRVRQRALRASIIPTRWRAVEQEAGSGLRSLTSRLRCWSTNYRGSGMRMLTAS